MLHNLYCFLESHTAKNNLNLMEYVNPPYALRCEPTQKAVLPGTPIPASLMSIGEKYVKYVNFPI